MEQFYNNLFLFIYLQYFWISDNIIVVKNENYVTDKTQIELYIRVDMNWARANLFCMFFL